MKSGIFVPDLGAHPMKWTCGATGACAAYSLRILEKYGPLNPNVVAEDWLLSFWAWLEGGIGVVNEPLVQHRTHGESLSVKARFPGRLGKRAARFEQRRKTQISPLAIAQKWPKAWRIAEKPDQDQRVIKGLQRFVALRKAQMDAFDASRLKAAQMALRVLALGGPGLAMKSFARHVLRIH